MQPDPKPEFREERKRGEEGERARRYIRSANKSDCRVIEKRERERNRGTERGKEKETWTTE